MHSDKLEQPALSRTRSTPARNDARSHSQAHLWGLCAVLIAAVIFGGGGSRYGLANLAVQLVAVGALAFHRNAFVDFWRNSPVMLKSLVGLSLLLPILFVIPLPSSVWTSLPGRELVAVSHELAGGIGWAAASVDPIRTLLALTALITPLAVLTIGWSTRRDQLITIGWVVVLLGLANMSIGIIQVLSNGATGLMYPENPMPGVLFGTFANRNTAGLFLVGCLALATFLPAPKQFGSAALAARMSICVLLVLAILLTRSRTAVVLAMLPLAAAGLQLIAARSTVSQNKALLSGRTMWAVLGTIALLIGAAATIGVAAPGRIGDVVERFQSERTDARTYIWEDASYAADRYWPVGAGFGTFDDVFQIDESLENITQKRAGRAHNDYLEVVIEAGLPGILLVAGWLLLLGGLSWKARLSEDRWIAWSGSIALLAVALQSITDYPLRNHTLLAFSTFALVMLVRFGRPRARVQA